MAIDRDSLEQTIRDLEPPTDSSVKVRVTIAGLAHCSLDEDKSEINFLRHLKGADGNDNHNLRLVIFKKRSDNTLVDTFVFGEDSPIEHGDEIEVSLDEAIELRSYVEEGTEHHLRQMINLGGLHRKNLELRIENQRPTRTKLTINDCAFYTHDLMRGLRLVGGPENIQKDIFVGYILGGYIRSEDDDDSLTLTGDCFEDGELVLPCSARDTHYFYDLVFNNHCSIPHSCREVIGNPARNTDFRFYYDVFVDDRDEDYKFDLEIRGTLFPPLAPTLSERASTIVAACNPVVTEPADWP